MNRISIISFTDQGEALTKRIEASIPDKAVKLYRNPKSGQKKWTKKQFKNGNVIIFVGACGIAVRLIAPCVKSKLKDPPVIVIDEKGRHVIPILSGHFGGANEMAKFIADKIGAEAVITTATDLNEKFAVDVFAKKNGLKIMNKDAIAVVSSKILKNEKTKALISMTKPKGVDKNKVLWLKPKLYVIGIGCKKDKPYKEISAVINKTLKKNMLKISDIYAIASIDIKKDEKGIRKWAGKNRVPFLTFSKDELMKTDGDFSGSDFVKNTVGIDNVCERAAVSACNNLGDIVLSKQAENGITLAIAKRKFETDKEIKLVL